VLSDRSLADLCAATYAPDHVPTYETPDVHVTVTKQGGVVYWAFRGSASLRDWFDDLLAVPVDETVDHEILGLCHPQFLRNALSVIEPLLRDIGDNPHVGTGHSKGGSEALDIGALLALRGKPPLRLVAFAPARAGALKGILGPIPGASYRFRDDPVPLLPTYLPPPRPLTQLGTPGVNGLTAIRRDFEYGFLADHHIANYQGSAPG
jgi:hypothetical protein